MKLQAYEIELYYKIWYMIFPCKFGETLQNIIFIEHLRLVATTAIQNTCLWLFLRVTVKKKKT